MSEETQGARDRERGNQLESLLLMLRELMRNKLTVRDLATRLHLKPRTVYRYLNIVQRSGVRVDQETSGVNSYYRVEPTSVRRALGL